MKETAPYEFNLLSEADRIPVVDIFNYYIENSFAAYHETTVSYDYFDRFLQMVGGYPAITVRNPSGIIGFSIYASVSPYRDL